MGIIFHMKTVTVLATLMTLCAVLSNARHREWHVSMQDRVNRARANRDRGNDFDKRRGSRSSVKYYPRSYRVSYGVNWGAIVGILFAVAIVVCGPVWLFIYCLNKHILKREEQEAVKDKYGQGGPAGNTKEI